ncbi:MAG: DEAD/DEAH box helicase [candidate division Zixibacteria bacterium]|nr:DEAD/DEAH box helicase [candidate division Zixibacteria bacterium]
MLSVAQVLDQLRSDRSFMDNITQWQVVPPRAGEYVDFPASVPANLRAVLEKRGIHRLYSHQAQVYEYARNGKHVTVVTPTASGKTLSYNLPILSRMIAEPETRALYLFPTKALSQDQMVELQQVIDALGIEINTYTFDGDTPAEVRRKVRKAGHIVVTNPDMLHSGVLPHHTKWIKLFENLKYIVIDEVHTYRGVFGSHLANVLRRLERICKFYGSSPQFICCSATIRNPKELAEQLTGRPMELVSKNGSPAGEKHFIFYNPPVINQQLGIRKSSLLEAGRVAQRFIGNRVQSIIFVPYRLNVELLLTYLRRDCPGVRIEGYRGGYLPNERREIERALRQGEITAVVSTNALELGIDIGSLDVSIICGYPGTIASTRQQSGRAGRKNTVSVSIMIASSSALNQYVVSHPEYFFEAPPEMGVIDPNNFVILTSHLKCGAFELPFHQEEVMGVQTTAEILDYLQSRGVLHFSANRWHWSSEIYPATEVSLRSASPDNFVILNTSDNNRVIGEVDYFSAPMLLHPEAIYIHLGNQYQVEQLDWEGKKAYVKEDKVDYYTDAETKADLKVIEVNDTAGATNWGEVSITNVTVLFKKIKFETHENVGSGKLALPEIEMHTTSFWHEYDEEIGEQLGFGRANLGAALRGVANVLGIVAPLYLMCDSRDLRSISQVKSAFTERPTIYIYESVPGGVGYAQKIFRVAPEIFSAAIQLIKDCPCQTGCPSCVGPEIEVGREGKRNAALLLEQALKSVTSIA